MFASKLVLNCLCVLHSMLDMILTLLIDSLYFNTFFTITYTFNLASESFEHIKYIKGKFVF